MRSWPHIPVGLSLVILAAAPGCADNPAPAPNRAPTVQLTTQPPAGGAPYAVTVEWSGEDPDGPVLEYRYAVNPPPHFSEEDIAGKTDLLEALLPGERGLPDRTRVYKLDGERMVTFDWIHTRNTGVVLSLNAPTPDPGETPATRFTGLHAVYVVAVDAERSRSHPATAAISVSTVVAASSIRRPVGSAEAITVGREVILVPQGTDEDNPDGPAAFEYKVVSFEDQQLLLSPDIPAFVKTRLEDPEEWFRVDARDAQVRLTLEERFGHYIAVRAVDAAGPREPFLELGRNVLRCRVNGLLGTPAITLRESLLGVVTAAAGDDNVLVVPTTTALRFTVSCDASAYGGVCEGLRWGVDLEDPEREDGWSPWSASPTLPPIRFPEPGLHTVTVQARDDLGNLGTQRYLFDALEFSFTEPVLFVDDSRDDNFPLDPTVDAFWQGLFENSRVDVPFVQHYVFGPDDFSTLAFGPDLATLSKYRLLVWDVIGGGYQGVTGFLQRTELGSELALYLRAGGQLWVDGRMVMVATTRALNHPVGDFSYPKSVRKPSFAWDFLKLFTNRVDNDRGTDSDNALWEALPMTEPAIYPRLEVSRDPRKLNRVQDATGGITRADAVFGPIHTDRVEGFTGVLDSLYAYGAAGPLRFGNNSTYHERLMATRWHDPDPHRAHGRVQWFGFPLYFFKDDQAQEVFDRSLEWFREEWPSETTGRRP